MSGKALRTLVVFCHPVRESFMGAALDAVVGSARAAGHELRVFDLYGVGFDPVLSREAWRGHLDPPETKPGIALYGDALSWCDTLILVYPTWYGAQPAMLKGWFDRILVQGVAYTLPAGASRIEPLLRNIRRLVVVTSHGSPKWLNAVQGEAGKRVVLRGVRSLCHPLVRTRWIALYGMDRAGDAARETFLGRVRNRVGRL